jgi:large subunit ribosomal protein L24
MNIKKDDNILVIAGKDKGKKGKVRFAYPRENKVLIEGVNFIKKHSKARGAAKQAGIIDLEAKMDVAKVMYVCARCSKPARIGTKILEDGRRARFCRACGEVIE